MTITVRAALPGDVASLVELRLANARAHVELDPASFRVPVADAVRRYFEHLLDGSTVLILVAEVDGEVAGMTEIVPVPLPPEHQILIAEPTADVHTVVLERFRGQGIGRILVEEAERAARTWGVKALNAVILTRNRDALRFYDSAGYGPRGTLLRKEL
ncbi:GNAT family N-acetyltransferase [Lentzea sp. NPDC051213]|uniref:GNAT family N-acetyltransferase n=1 Tax=Lentzea sp. NPDC051213 TaxID=3364126 RepID=UPI0037B43FB6